MSRFITWSWVMRLGIGSFAGLALSSWIDYAAFGGKGEFAKTAVGEALVDVFAFVWIVTLLVLIPLRVFFDRKEVRQMQQRVREGEIDPHRLGPLRRHLFYANFGSLPKWLYLPLVAVALSLAAALILIPIAVLLVYILIAILSCLA